MDNTEDKTITTGDSFTSTTKPVATPAKVEAKEKSTRRPKPVYGEEITVETTGDFGLYDPATGTSFDDQKDTKTKYSRFIETNISRGKLRRK